MLSIHSSPIGALGTKDTGGMSVYVRELSHELGRRGHRVDIFTRQNHTRHRKVLDLYPNVRLVYLNIGNDGPISKSALHAYMKEFSDSLEQFRSGSSLCYDLIHSHYWLSGLLGKYAQQHWNVLHVLMFHTLGAVKNRTGIGVPESDLRIASEEELAKTCHRILAPTENEKENVITYYGAPQERIGVVPCGVNLNLFRPMDRLVARRRVGFDPKESIVLYVGRFDPLKGIDRLFSSVAHLKHRRRFRLVIIGGDGRRSLEFKNLQELSRQKGIEDRVTFVGRVDQKELPPYYSAADVLVVPSYYESFGLVGLESLACGTPVVSTPVGKLQDILKSERIGRVVRNADPRSIARGIEAFLANSHKNRWPADTIRSTILPFHWSTVASAVIDEYRTVFRDSGSLPSKDPIKTRKEDYRMAPFFAPQKT